eukprot:Gb_15710 [translate_table: standard]
MIVVNLFIYNLSVVMSPPFILLSLVISELICENSNDENVDSENEAPKGNNLSGEKIDGGDDNSENENKMVEKSDCENNNIQTVRLNGGNSDSESSDSGYDNSKTKNLDSENSDCENNNSNGENLEGENDDWENEILNGEYPNSDSENPDTENSDCKNDNSKIEILDDEDNSLDDEEYWKRRAILRWQNCDVSAHGRSWKELYFERNTAAALESFDPTIDDEEDLKKLLELSAPFVHSLEIYQLPSHMSASLIFNTLGRIALPFMLGS